MEESSRRSNVNRRMVAPKPPPPKPKPKPPKLSTNKVNNDSTPPKRTSSNSNSNSLPIRGNVSRLSSVFEESRPSLPLSPKLPVPNAPPLKKSRSRDRTLNNKKTEVDESHYTFSDMQAKFQQAEGSDVTLPNPAKKPAALRGSSSKSPERMTNTINRNTINVSKTRVSINTRNDTNNKKTTVKSKSPVKTQSDTKLTQPDLKLTQPNSTTTTDDDLENLGRDWIDITDNYLPEIEDKPTKGVRGSLVKTKKPSRLNINSSNDVLSSPKKQNSLISPDDFEAKRASLANHFAARNSGSHYSKTLPPTPSPKSLTLPSPQLSAHSNDSNNDYFTSPVGHSKDSSIESSVDNDSKGDLEHNRRKKLWNVIKELVDTERTFKQDMELLKEVYSDPAETIPIFDRFACKTIFSNLPEIIEFSEEFLELLERAAGIEDLDDNNNLKHLENENDNTYIGAAFSQMMKRQQGDESRMEAVYSEYCKRHEAAVQKLQEFDKDKDIQGWLQMCKYQCEGRTRSWDISSLLIKPVQRVLKYPLLLQQIESLTKPSHPDFEELKFAFSEIQKIAERINNIKRRKDVVEKIVGSKKKTETDLVHGITKSITRRGQMIKRATGIAKANEVDELYNHYVEKFKNLESRGQQLSKDVREWVKMVKLYFEDQERMAAVFEDFYTLGDQANKQDDYYKKLVEYVKAIREIAPTHVREMEEAITKRIHPQIERFLELFKAPAAVMKKREKKFLDFDRAMAIKSKGGTLDKQLQQSVDAFRSISEQLNEELPSFFRLMIQYFDIIIQELITIQSRLYKQIGMDFSQFYYKFIEPQALKEVSNDRELVLREMDIESEYTELYHGELEMEDELNSFFLLTGPTGFGTSENGRGRRSSWSDSSGSSRRAEDTRKRSVSKDPNNRKGGLWDDNADRISLHSHNSSEMDLNQNIHDNEFNFLSIKQKQTKRNKHSSHKKYATDSAIDIRENDNKISTEKKDETLFLCQTLYPNKSSEKNELNFKRGVLLNIIHIDDTGEWWFAVNEDTKERGWVEPGFVERIG